MSVHFRIDRFEVLKEVQEDGVRVDDDLPAEHADKRLDLGGFSDDNSRGLCLPELF